jgi:hypothetical protein
VPGSAFKADGAPRERRHGGFDSRSLPPFPRRAAENLTTASWRTQARPLRASFPEMGHFFTGKIVRPSPYTLFL